MGETLEAIGENGAWRGILAVRGRFRDTDERPGWALVRRSGDWRVVKLGAGDAVASVDADGAVKTCVAAPDAVSTMFRLYLPLFSERGGIAVGHLGQTLDGKIATVNGASHYVTGPQDILHNHRMRALSDAVVVGSGTVRHDDPQLTVRHCLGGNPVRVVIDAERRLSVDFSLFQDGAAPTILICAADKVGDNPVHGLADVVGLPRSNGGLSPRRLRAALAARGLRSLFIEGGGVTISRFLQAKCLDRLQVTIAPMIIGSGRPGISLPEVASLNEGMRPATRRFDFGDDVMFECRFDD